MAEGKRERRESSSEESVKLFVGQVPKNMTEVQLLTMFREFALVDEVNIIKDKTTRASRGSFSLSLSLSQLTFSNFLWVQIEKFLSVSQGFVWRTLIFFLVSVGCCFVICPTREEADKAVNACHNKKTLSGVSSIFDL